MFPFHNKKTVTVIVGKPEESDPLKEAIKSCAMDLKEGIKNDSLDAIEQALLAFADLLIAHDKEQDEE